MARALLVFNPAAGRGRGESCARSAAHRLEEAGWSVELARTQPGQGPGFTGGQDSPWDVVVPVGGDGTIHLVLNELLRRGGPLPGMATLPAGSGNSLALDLGLRSPDQALERLLSGERRALDGIRVTLDGERTLHAVNIVGWGAAASINSRAERMRWARGRRYDVASLVEIARLDRSAARYVVDGEAFEGQLLGVACITCHSGRGMRLAPDARLDDGRFDLVEIRAGGRLQLVRMLASVQRGAHVDSDLVRIRQAQELEVELRDGAGLVVDGEWVPCHRAKLCIEPRIVDLWA